MESENVVCCCVSCSVISDSETPWSVAHQAPPSMGFSRQEYLSGLPFPSSGDLPKPGIEPESPALQALLFLLTLHPPADFNSWWETVSSWFEVVPISCLVSMLKLVIRIVFISPGRGRALSPLVNMLLVSDAVRSQDLAQQGHQEPVSHRLKGARHQLDAVTAH